MKQKSDTGKILLIAALLICIVLRLLACYLEAPAPIAGGLLQVLEGATFLEVGNTWDTWKHSILESGAGGAIYDSALLTPLYALWAWLFGVSFNTAAFAGTLAAVLTAYLAFEILKTNDLAIEGALAAGIIATSPLQITWSVLGYRPIWALPHVLLIVLVSQQAARKSSRALGALAGLLIALTIYQHDIARVGFAVGPITFVASSRATQLKTRNHWLCFLSMILVGAIAISLSSDRGLLQTIWPRQTVQDFPGYNENTAAQFLVYSVTRFFTGLYPVVRDLFFARGDAHPWSGFHPFQADYGGHILLPVLLFGIVGFVSSARRPAVAITIFGLFLAGVGVTAIGCSQARWLLVPELAWNIYAGLGLGWLLGMLAPRPRLTFCLAITVFGATGLQSIWLLTSLAKSASPYGGKWHTAGLKTVAFSEGCSYDTATCPRCLALAKWWQKQARSGRLVMVVNEIPYDAGTPAELTEYIQIASRALGDRDSILDFYNYRDNSRDVPRHLPYYPHGQHWTTALQVLLTNRNPESMLWYFDRPNSWEKHLAARLVAVGGIRTDLSGYPERPKPFFVEVGRAAYESMLLVLSELETPRNSIIPLCPVLQETQQIDGNGVIVAGSVAGSTTDSNNPWVLFRYDAKSRFRGISYKNLQIDTEDLVALHARTDESGLAATAVTSAGSVVQITLADPLTPHQKVLQLPEALRRGCTTIVNNQVWAIDPSTGQQLTPNEQLNLPAESWIGIASDGEDRLVLAAASQKLYFYDLRANRLITTIETPTIPWHSWGVNECVQLVATTSWFGILNQRPQRQLLLYSEDGKPIGAVDTVSLLGTADLVPFASNKSQLLMKNEKQAGRLSIFEIKGDGNCHRFRLPKTATFQSHSLFNFETPLLPEWKIDGDSFGPEGRHDSWNPLPGQWPISGYSGRYFVNSFHQGDGSTGSVFSPSFEITYPYLKYSIGGGESIDTEVLRLIVGGQVVRTATGDNSESLHAEAWDVTEFLGQQAHLEIVDDATGSWGHLLVDDIAFVPRF